MCDNTSSSSLKSRERNPSRGPPHTPSLALRGSVGRSPVYYKVISITVFFLLLLLQDIYRALQYVKNSTQRWTYLFTTCQNSLCPWSKSHRNQGAVELNN